MIGNFKRAQKSGEAGALMKKAEHREKKEDWVGLDYECGVLCTEGKICRERWV